jgi:UDP-N-acetylmuramyl pentapeptide synthase
MRAFAAQVPVVTYSMHKSKQADVWPEKMIFSLWETELKIHTPVGSLLILTPLIGRHNVYNILAAVAVGLAVTVEGEPIPLKVWLSFMIGSSFVPQCHNFFRNLFH